MAVVFCFFEGEPSSSSLTSSTLTAGARAPRDVPLTPLAAGWARCDCGAWDWDMREGPACDEDDTEDEVPFTLPVRKSGGGRDRLLPYFTHQ